MSVLIRGMVMPERCGQCFLRVGNCKQRMYMEHRPKDCPLVEVEPHGDLTDKDKRNARIIIDALRMAKTVEPEPHWIPCSERLPEVQGCYLVTEQITGVSTVDIRYYNIDDDGQYWSGWKDYIVLAWMPLPEPYKGVNT